MRKKRFSIDEHIDTGRKIKKISKDFNVIANNIWRNYPKQHKAAVAVSKLHKLLSELKSILENDMFLNFPELPREYVNVYFGADGHFENKPDEFQKYGEIKILIEGDNNLIIKVHTEYSYLKDKEELIRLLNSNVNDYIASVCDEANVNASHKLHQRSNKNEFNEND